MNMNDFGRIAVNMLPDMGNDLENMEKGLMFLDDHMEEAAAAYARIEAGAEAEAYVEAADTLVYMLGCMLADIALVCHGLMMSMNTVAVKYIIDTVKNLRGDGSKGEKVQAVGEGSLDTMGILRSIYELAGGAVKSHE